MSYILARLKLWRAALLIAAAFGVASAVYVIVRKS